MLGHMAILALALVTLVAGGTLVGTGSSGTLYVNRPASLTPVVTEPGENLPSDAYRCVDAGPHRMIVRAENIARSNPSIIVFFSAFTDSSTGEVSGQVVVDQLLSAPDINAQIVEQAKRTLSEQCGSVFPEDLDVVLFAGAASP
jgi:hypothetical protein